MKYVKIKEDILDTELWNSIHKQATALNKEKTLFKIYEWDGVVYHFGLHAPKEPLPANHCFVIGTEKILSALQQQVETPVELPQIPEEIPSSAIDIPIDTPIDTPEGIELTEQPEGLQMDAPEGLGEAAAQLPELDNLEGLSEELPQIVSEAPEGLGDAAIEAVPEAPEGVLSFEQETPTDKPQQPPIPLQSKKVSVPVGQYDSVMNQIKNTYKEVVLFEYTNSQFVPVNWSENFKASSFNAIDTKTPSAFRIVEQTNQAYLGHLVKTDVNDQLVSQWFPENKPEKLLVQPIIMAKNLVGAFMIVCATDSQNHMVLSKGEETAKEIVLNWPQSSAKAA